MAAAPPRRLRLLGTERAGRTRDGPRTSVDALRAGRRCGLGGHRGAGGRRARLGGPQPNLSIRLEPLGAEHVADVEAMLGDPDLLRFTRIPEPVPPGFASAWLERYEEGRRDGSREAFAIAGGEGEFMGIVMAPRIDRETQTAELGYVVASKKVAERCGYVFEGVLRSHYFKPGLREDTEIWSRLATDP